MSPITHKNLFNKMQIDFEYNNEIYNIFADRYKTLSELKETIRKKIYPVPQNIHCFYNNIDLYKEEDDQISETFPQKNKIKITLKTPRIINSNSVSKFSKSINFDLSLSGELNLNYKNNKNFNELKTISGSTNSRSIKESSSDSLFHFNKNVLNQYKTPRKHLKSIKIPNLEQLDLNDFLNDYKSKDKNIFKSINNHNHKNGISICRNDFLKSHNNNKKNNEINYNLDKNNEKYFEKDQNNNTDKKYKIKLEKSKKKGQNLNAIKKIKESKIDENNLQNLEISYNENEAKNNETNKKQENDINMNIPIDKEYKCSICKHKTNVNKKKQNILITNYCINCKNFLCKNCNEECKSHNHQTIPIKINDDCIDCINSYGSFLISDIEKKISDFSNFNHQITTYDIKEKKKSISLLIKDLINLYKQIIKILTIIYQTKNPSTLYSSYKINSNQIKEEVNEIINKAEAYLKEEKQINEPKVKIMNIKYYFKLIDEKMSEHNSLSEKIKVFSLNKVINNNIENAFDSFENSIKEMIDKNNPFNLNNEFNTCCKQLLEEYKSTNKNNTSNNIKEEQKQVVFNKNIEKFPLIKKPIKRKSTSVLDSKKK